MQNSKIAFIGGGNMAASIIAGLIEDGFNPDDIWVANPGQEKRDRLKANFGIHVTPDNHEAAQHCDVVIFSVKPQILPEVAKDLAADIAAKKPLVISLAAGILLDSLTRWLGSDVAIARVMPNTPALLGCGATGLYANALVSEFQREITESIFRSVGIVVWAKTEAEFDVIMVLASSGPGYMYLILDTMQQKAIELGLSAEDAKLLTLQQALGSAKVAFESAEDLDTLKQQMALEGGVTEQALKTLEAGGLSSLIGDAMEAALRRSKEIEEEFGKL